MPAFLKTPALRILLAVAAVAGVLVFNVPWEARAADSTRASSGAVVTYSGLKVYEDGSSTLRVNLSRQVPVEFERKGKALTFLLRGAKVQLRNNKNPLRAEHFNSNVVRAKLDDTRRGVKLSVMLRNPAEPQRQMIRHAGGAILRIDIPPAAK